MTAITRRSGLARLAALAAGALGLGAAETAGTAGASARKLRLTARHLRRDAGGLGRGDLAASGERLTAQAELFDSSGARAGEFHAACFVLHGADLERPGSERMELHTFTLNDGTIIGSGTSGRFEGTFAILGGTGRYAGARGTYAARQHPRDLGGDGGAEFVFDLVV